MITPDRVAAPQLNARTRTVLRRFTTNISAQWSKRRQVLETEGSLDGRKRAGGGEIFFVTRESEGEARLGGSANPRFRDFFLPCAARVCLIASLSN